MRKRFLTLGLAVLMAVSLTACGGGDDSSKEEKTTTEAKKRKKLTNPFIMSILLN